MVNNLGLNFLETGAPVTDTEDQPIDPEIVELLGNLGDLLNREEQPVDLVLSNL